MAEERKKESRTFGEIGLDKAVLDALRDVGYRLPSPIQRKTIPVLAELRDVVVTSRTGSGKTGAFTIPIVQILKTHSFVVGARALVVSPSRELAEQTYKYVLGISKYTDLKCALFDGTDHIHRQFDSLSRNPDIIVATPGRLLHMMKEAGREILGRIRIVVFDEADRLLEENLWSQLGDILSSIPRERTVGLFSATLSEKMVELSATEMRDPAVIKLDAETRLSPTLRSFFFLSRTEEKIPLLLFLLTSPQSPIFHHLNEGAGGGGIVFVSSRHHVELLHDVLRRLDICHLHIYGVMDGSERRRMFGGFRKGEVRILVSTDLAARGVDIPSLGWIINYDFPCQEPLFIHRAGRVARMGQVGDAISLVTPLELPYLLDLQAFLARRLVHKAGGQTDFDYTKEIVIGKVPRVEFSGHVEIVEGLLRENSDIEASWRAMQNSEKRILKCRAPPKSRGGCSQVEIDTHPLWIENRQTKSLICELRAFRPSNPICRTRLCPKKKKSTGVQKEGEDKRDFFYMEYGDTGRLGRTNMVNIVSERKEADGKQKGRTRKYYVDWKKKRGCTLQRPGEIERTNVLPKRKGLPK